MQFRQLRYFVKIVEAGSFSKAASVVHVAQPALSQQVAELEDRLGVELLLRSARGVRPTAAGDILYKEATIILQQLDRLALIGSSASGEPAGTVNLGLVHSIASKLLGGLLDEAPKHLPKVTLRVSDDSRVSLESKIASGALDLAILYEDEIESALQRLPLFTQKMYLVSHRLLPDHSGDVISRQDVARLPLVLPGQNNSRRSLIDRAFAQSNLTLNVALEAESLNSAIWAMLNNSGSAILPLGDMSHFGPSAFVKPLLIDPPITLTCSMVRSADFPLTAAGQAMHDFLLAHIEERVRQPDMTGAEWIGNTRKKR